MPAIPFCFLSQVADPQLPFNSGFLILVGIKRSPEITIDRMFGRLAIFRGLKRIVAAEFREACGIEWNAQEHDFSGAGRPCGAIVRGRRKKVSAQFQVLVLQHQLNRWRALRGTLDPCEWNLPERETVEAGCFVKKTIQRAGLPCKIGRASCRERV